MRVAFERGNGSKVLINMDRFVYAFEQVHPVEEIVTGIGVVLDGCDHTLVLPNITLEQFMEKTEQK